MLTASALSQSTQQVSTVTEAMYTGSSSNYYQKKYNIINLDIICRIYIPSIPGMSCYIPVHTEAEKVWKHTPNGEVTRKRNRYSSPGRLNAMIAVIIE